METQDFARFVASQQQTDVGTEIDWAGMRDQWLSELSSLYRKIADFLQEYVANGSVKYSFTQIELNEENIGKYLARRMDIRIGRQSVSLVPVGTLLIGCRGRVDIEGAAGRAQILLVDERATSAADLIKVTVNIKGNVPPPPPPPLQPITWAWKIVSNAAQRRFVDLDKESFFAVLMEIANA